MSARPRLSVGRRVLLALIVVVTLVVGAASPAAAHGGAVASTDYRARITAVSPRIDGVEIRLIEAAGRVELANRTSADVVVLGYEDEPYLRIGPRGVFENRRSPAVYLNATRSGGEPAPADATADAEPRWVRIADEPVARWHDHRLHWMTSDPEEVRTQPGRRHRVAEWELPVRLDQRELTVRGEIVYVPGPPVWPWLAGAVVLAGVVFVVVRHRLLAAAVALLGAADVVRVAGLTFVVVGDAGERFQQAVDVGTLSFVGWGLGVVAVARLRGGHDDGPVAAGLAGMLLAVAGGVLEWGDLGRSQLAFALAGDVLRACVAAISGVGVGVTAAVLVRATQVRRAATPAGR